MKGIDCSVRLNADKAKTIKKLGYDFVGRYVVPQSRAKALTLAEAKCLREAGLGILLCWELTEDRVKGGAEKGTLDGASASFSARVVGAPEGTTIYYAVDYEPTAKDMNAIEAYLRAAKKAADGYRCGVYGNYAVIEEMSKRTACDCYWQCVAWSYGKKSKAMNVYQSEWQLGAEALRVGNKLGFYVDINECNDYEAAGLWPSDNAEEDSMAEKRFNTIKEIPEWGRPTIKKLCELGVLQGKTGVEDEQGYPVALDLSSDMIRMFVINDRAGIYGKVE